MMNYLRFSWIGPLLVVMLALCACSESDEKDHEYADWKARNSAYFTRQMQLARDSIRMARQQYGDAWEDHCAWRTYLSYSLQPGIPHTETDSICVQILRRGTGEGYPLATDSVRVNYRALLMPTESYPQGRVVDHSGQAQDFDRVFDRQTAAPATFHANSLVRGFTTALLYMRPGDLWRVYLPSGLAYEGTAQSSIPAYSTLTFEIDLVAYYRKGIVPDPWQ